MTVLIKAIFGVSYVSMQNMTPILVFYGFYRGYCHVY